MKLKTKKYTKSTLVSILVLQPLNKKNETKS